MVKLYNRNESAVNVLMDGKADYGKRPHMSCRRTDFTKEKGMICSVLKKQGSITRKEVEELLDIKTTKVFRILKEMCDEGMLIQRNSGRITCYYSKD